MEFSNFQLTQIFQGPVEPSGRDTVVAGVRRDVMDLKMANFEKNLEKKNNRNR